MESSKSSPTHEKDLLSAPMYVTLIIADEAFKQNDLNHDGQLSLFEFKKWYQAYVVSSKGPNLSSSSGLCRHHHHHHIVDRETTSPREDVEEEDHGGGGTPYSLAEIRELTNLKNVSTGNLLDLISSHAACKAANRHILQVDVSTPLLRSMSDPHKADGIQFRMFDIFDTSRDGIVNLSELSCGLSVLCGGTFRKKSRPRFRMYDLNGDVFISMEEMVRYLTSVFKVVFETLGLTAEDLGKRLWSMRSKRRT